MLGQHSDRQQGFSLVELITVVALASIALVGAVTYSLPWMAQQTMRSALHDVQAFVQLAKIEAVSRNRPCRFVMDTGSGRLEVWDSLATGSITDDQLLHHGRIPDSVRFDRPDAGPSVTLEQIGSSSRYQTVFRGDGMVSSGTGDVCLLGGARFGRLAVYAAGGVETSHWNGQAWLQGS